MRALRERWSHLDVDDRLAIVAIGYTVFALLASACFCAVCAPV